MEIGKKSRVRVIWKDKLSNYSKENKEYIKTTMSEKYEIPKTRIKIDFRSIDENNSVTNISDTIIEDIMNRDYQIKLMEEFGNKNDMNLDIKSLIDIDKDVIDKLDTSISENRFKKWKINKLTFFNFLSFHKETTIDFDALNGITVVNGLSPFKNQAGKTVLFNSILFLLYGSTNKSTKVSEIYNLYSGENTLYVDGEFTIDSKNIKIKRSSERKLKKSGEYAYTNKVEYYHIDGDITINLEGEQRNETEKLISSFFGNKEDFMMTVFANSYNLEDILYTKPAERTRLLNRYIGLEILEKKEQLSKEAISAKSKGFISNVENINDLVSSNEELNNKQLEKENEITQSHLEIDENKNLKIKLINDRLVLNNKIVSINQDVIYLNENDLLREKENIMINGKNISVSIENLRSKIVVITDNITELLNKSEEYDTIKNDTTTKLLEIRFNIKNKNAALNDIINNSVCSACNRAYENLDNQDKVSQINKDLFELKELELKYTTISEKNKLDILDTKSKIDTIRNNDSYNISITKFEYEIKNERLKYKEIESKLLNINNNRKFIEFNKEIQADIIQIDNKIFTIDEIINNQNKLIGVRETTIIDIKNRIDVNNNKIVTIEKENIIKKNYSDYIKLMGRTGISRMIIKNVIPVMNHEIEKTIADTCDFSLELVMNEKEEIDFVFTRDGISNIIEVGGSGYEETISAFVIRSVLGRVSTLPKTSVLFFDEVLGKVSDENLPNFKTIIDRLKDMYDNIFFITHDDNTKDWGDNSIFIEKVDNISRIAEINIK